MSDENNKCGKCGCDLGNDWGHFCEPCDYCGATICDHCGVPWESSSTVCQPCSVSETKSNIAAIRDDFRKSGNDVADTLGELGIH
jgi:hypothetical protein